ncbi:uncharacterized protein [Diabrotica undecimpunctata]|uniref:uncharacterized protein n=1 Tax=Diabrotica undecimpunctata TaxID=50387 RepID=UPI003B634486
MYSNRCVQLFLCVILFCQICSIKSQCVGRFTIEDEEDSDILYRFMDTLERYTGLSGNYRKAVTVNCPRSGICLVNPQGSAIWEARLEFYTPYVLNSSSTHSSTETLDSCICYSRTNYQFQDCLINVRQNMLLDLDTKLVPTFRRIVEQDRCASFKENCL